MVSALLVIVQLFFTIIIGLYFLNVLRNQQNSHSSLEKESERELLKLEKLRSIHLTEPLTEKTRPKDFSEIHGQDNGIVALKAALCGPNPQHVIIYGPPGVGKTAAARAALAEASKNLLSPFARDAKFIEVDATALRFDDRGIADPLIGSVHDPIYQGAGAYGPGGIPQPKAGAVTKAHGGILFIDEIGELHSVQLNKLLKVLEDRRVLFESSYYSRDNKEIPRHVHEIFQKGLPADFRLVGATTRSPSEIPSAIRSRCAEVFFDALTEADLMAIAQGAAAKGGFQVLEDAIETVVSYSQNGRDAVNIIQTAGSYARCSGRCEIQKSDILWVAEAGRYSPRLVRHAEGILRTGCVSGLAVMGLSGGIVMDIEAVFRPAREKGTITLTGAIDREETDMGGRKLSRTGTARASIENALCAMEVCTGQNTDLYNININFPGGYPADGPSAGAAVFTALYSAFNSVPVPDTIAITGEISAKGQILPVGGVPQKICAAREAAIKKVFIPLANFNERFSFPDIEIIPISHVSQIISCLFGREISEDISAVNPASASATAEGIKNLT